MLQHTDKIVWEQHVFLSFVRAFLAYTVAVLVGLVAGIVSAKGEPGLAAIFAGFLAMVVVASSRNLLFWFIIIGGIVITGIAQLYLPGSKYLRYIIPLATGALFLHAVLDYIRSYSPNTALTGSGIAPWALVFLTIALISTATNWSDIGVAIVGLKGYFQVWLFFFAFILIQWKRDVLDSLPKAMLMIALLQLPFILHQYLVLVPMRTGITGVPVDVVAGTFGATLFGGGANAALAAFMLIVFACLVGLWKHGALSSGKAAVLSLLLVFPVFINEAKISVVYLAVIFVILFYRDIIDRPLRFIVAASIAAGMIAALLTALTLLHPTGKMQSWSDLFEFMYKGQTASISERSGMGSELSRWTALTFWAQEHVSANPANIIIGHGPGASRVQDSGLDLAETLAETRYRGLKIGYTAISAILWDTGILGMVAIIGLYLSAFLAAGRLARHYKGVDAFQAGIFDGLRAGVLILFISLAHKDFFAAHIPYQTMTLIILGYLVIASQRIAQSPENQRNRPYV
jgi:hypothetical protein